MLRGVGGDQVVDSGSSYDGLISKDSTESVSG